jgi:serine/threonine-protein kinase
MDASRWRRLEELFDRALALDPSAREPFLAHLARADPAAHCELAALLRAHDSAGAFLSGSAEAPGGDIGAATGSLAPGTRLGAWRIVQFISHGGMGEVYEAARTDGQFEQRAALKLTRPDAPALHGRFSAERQMLARLDHPGIARLLDGGITDDGRPFAVMEFVEGRTIVEWCAARRLPLRDRLVLFLQVCDAVAHAHGQLIVHRDLKPSNVLVDAAGRVRLLDFGIAKPLDAAWPGSASAGETSALMTPDYAAPEQLSGEQITTATDVYGLGMLLFEMLTERRPWQHRGRPIARVLHELLETPAPLPSAVADTVTGAPIEARALRGDFDAIVAKALRREPGARYATVSDLRRDISAALDGRPVAARGEAGWYLFGTLARRHRWALAATAAIVLLLTAGIAATWWQAERATLEARRAERTRDFLVSVFQESDPRFARDRRAGSLTARELLDASVGRIPEEFADDAESQLELLRVARDIYGYWNDDERFVDLSQRYAEIARARHGETHPAFIENELTKAWSAIYSQDTGSAERDLARADALIRQGGHDGTALRADWWVARASLWSQTDARRSERAVNNAIEIYTAADPSNPGLPIALANSGISRYAREDYAGAQERFERAIPLFEDSKLPVQDELVMTLTNLARARQQLGDAAGAERTYERALALARRIDPQGFWLNRADHAKLIHLRGDRERALKLFSELLESIPADYDVNVLDVITREYYAERLVAEGRPAEALPLLEEAERTYVARPYRETDLRRMRLALGDAYDRLGRTEDARRTLSAAREERLARDAPDSVSVLAARERWARLLVSTGDLEGAGRELDLAFAALSERSASVAALLHDTRARLHMAAVDAAAALTETRAALEVFARAKGNVDVRTGPRLWRTHADALEATGDAVAAREWRDRALEASRRYDAPTSPTVAPTTGSPRRVQP